MVVLGLVIAIIPRAGRPLTSSVLLLHWGRPAAQFLHVVFAFGPAQPAGWQQWLPASLAVFCVPFLIVFGSSCEVLMAINRGSFSLQVFDGPATRSILPFCYCIGAGRPLIVFILLLHWGRPSQLVGSNGCRPAWPFFVCAFVDCFV